MAYSALVLQLLLSGPGDLPARDKALIQRAIRLWNNQHARLRGIQFSSTDWNEDGTPGFGEYAQGVLNEQIGDESDSAIVVFTDRLGTPTPEHESGTAEEIARMRGSGKDVAILLNCRQRSPLTGAALVEKLRLDQYIDEMGKQAFIGKYDSDAGLQEVISGLLTRIASKYRREAERDLVNPLPNSAEPKENLPAPESDLLGVWPRIEVSESVEANSRGRLQTRRRWSLVLENNSDSPVTDVNFWYEDADGNQLQDFDLLSSRHEPVAVLAPHSSLRFPIMQAWGSPQSALCVVEWTNAAGERRTTRATVRTL